MPILVTGAAGFIGSRRARYAVDAMIPLRAPGSLLQQGLRPRTPVLAAEVGGQGNR
jgi:nucleoside-diphosphate-sugar epimerase